MPQNSPAIGAVNELLDAWFAECIQQPPIAHSVESYNQAHAAHAELKRRMCLLVTGEEPVVQAEAAASISEPEHDPGPQSDQDAGGGKD